MTDQNLSTLSREARDTKFSDDAGAATEPRSVRTSRSRNGRKQNMSLFGWLKRIFRGAPAQTLDDRLAALERKAEATPSMYRALIFKQAGDLCATEGATDQALKYYGRAIDAYIDTGFFDSAAVVCRKVIDLSPSVVRARCTLAFLSLGKGLLYLPFEGLAADARREISDYVHSAQQQGRENLAVKRLHLMAEATDSDEIREMIGEYLMELGDTVGANDVLGVVFAERNQVREPPPEDQRERWASALRVSVVTPPGQPRQEVAEVAEDAGGVEAEGTAEDAEDAEGTEGTAEDAEDAEGTEGTAEDAEDAGGVEVVGQLQEEDAPGDEQAEAEGDEGREDVAEEDAEEERS